MSKLTSIINTKDGDGNFVLNNKIKSSWMLQPQISQDTINFHFYKHLQSYIDKVNYLKPGDSTIEDIILRKEYVSRQLYNNASQVYNHYFYFEQLQANTDHMTCGVKMNKLINESFNSFENFKKEFIKSGMNIFGSGWVFLVLKNNKLSIESYIGTDTPLKNCKPLIALDVWEHAYYLDYYNNRENYINAFFKLLDWEVIENRLDE